MYLVQLLWWTSVFFFVFPGGVNIFGFTLPPLSRGGKLPPQNQNLPPLSSLLFFFRIFDLFFITFSFFSPIFPRKKRKTLFSAEISPFRSGFQKFKMEFEALTRLFYLPYQIVSDFDVFCAVLKLSISAFWKPKFYQNPLRSGGVNKTIQWQLQIPFWIFENGFEMAKFRQKMMFLVFPRKKWTEKWKCKSKYISKYKFRKKKQSWILTKK